MEENGKSIAEESKNSLWKGLAIIFIVLFILTASVLVYFLITEQKESSQSSQQTGIANPASVFCEQRGYNLTIVTASDGSQAGYCVFPDENRCDEWAFYRGECSESTAANQSA